MPVVTEDTCKAAMAPWITEDMICAGGRLGEDACGVGSEQGFAFSDLKHGYGYSNICAWGVNRTNKEQF